MYSRRILYLSFFISIFISSCGYDINKEVSPDDESIVHLDVEKNLDSDQDEQLARHYNSLDKKLYEKCKANCSDDEQIILAKNISKIIFNEKNLSTTGFVENQRSKDLLMYFNYILVQVKESGGHELDTLLLNYKAALLRGCDKNYNGCNNLNYFLNDSKTLSVLYLISKDEDVNTKEYYQTLRLAHKSQNFSSHKRLNQDYYHYLVSQILDKKDKNKNYINWTEESNRFQIIESNFTSEEIDELIENFSKKHNLFRMLKAFSEKKIISRLSKPIFNKIYNPSILSQFKALAIENEALDSIKKTELSQNRFTIKSYKETIEHARKIFPSSFESFSVEPLNLNKMTAEETYYYYLLNGLFHNKVSLYDAGMYWDSLNKRDLKVFARVFKSYIYTYIVSATMDTHDYLSKNYKKNEGELGDTQVREFLSRSYDTLDFWNDLQDRISYNFSPFIAQNISSKHYDLNDDTAQAVYNILYSIPSNIKFMATYPLQILLSYIVVNESVKQFEENTKFGRVSLHSDNIILNLFQSQQLIIIPFGNNMDIGISTGTGSMANNAEENDVINSFDLMYAFEYLFASNFFNLYGINEKTFFHKVFKNYLNRTFESGHENYNSVIEYYEVTKSKLDSSEIGELLNNCQSHKDGEKVRVRKSPYSISRQFVYGAPGMSFNNESQSIMDDAQKLISRVRNMHPDNYYVKQISHRVGLEYMRATAQAQLEKVNMIFDIYENFLIKNNFPNENLSNSRSYIDKEYKYYAEEYVKLSFEALDRVYDCMQYFSELEQRRRDFVIIGFMTFIENFYLILEDLKYLIENGSSYKNATNQVQSEFPKLNIWKSPQFNDLDKNLDFLSAINIKLNSFDITAPVMRDIPFDTVSKNPIQISNGNITLNFKSYMYLYRLIDILENGYYLNGKRVKLNDGIEYDYFDFPPSGSDLIYLKADHTKKYLYEVFSRSYSFSQIFFDKQNFIKENLRMIFEEAELMPVMSATTALFAEMQEISSLKLKMSFNDFYDLSMQGCAGEMGIIQSQECEDHIFKEIDTLKDRIIRYYNYLKLDNTKKKYLESMSFTDMDMSKTQQNFSSDFIIEDENQKLTGYFDFFFDHTSSDFVGIWGDEPVRNRTEVSPTNDGRLKDGILKQALKFSYNFHKSHRAIGIDENGFGEIDRKLRAKFFRRVTTYFSMVELLINRVKDYEQHTNSEFPEFHFRTYQDPVKLNFISQKSIDDYRAEKLMFHCNSKGMFLGKNETELIRKVKEKFNCTSLEEKYFYSP